MGDETWFAGDLVSSRAATRTPRMANDLKTAADVGRVEWLLTWYAERFGRDFLAVLPVLEKAPV